MRVLSVDVGIRHLAWFAGEIEGRVGEGVSPLCHVTCVLEQHNWQVVDIVPKGITNVNEVRVEELVPWMLAAFHQHKPSMLGHDGTLERVYLEQQPLGSGPAAARNIKTKVLSHILQALILQEIPSLAVVFVSPRKKIRHAALVLGHAPETYNDNKKAAKLLAPRLLRDLGALKLADWYERAKGKKDDLADSLLQAIYAVDDEFEEQRLQAGRDQRAKTALEPKRPAKRKKTDQKVSVEATAAASAAVLGRLPSSGVTESLATGALSLTAASAQGATSSCAVAGSLSSAASGALTAGSNGSESAVDKVSASTMAS